MKQTTIMRDSQSFLPFDVALKIASLLEVFDLCVLGSCSLFWRDLCRSDCLWEFPTKERWPSGVFNRESSPSSSVPMIKGWKEIYAEMHREMASKAANVIEFVEIRSSSQSLAIEDYKRAILELWKEKLAFEDVQLFLFKPNLNVLLNLVGLHYCIFCLKLPARSVMNVLQSCKIPERQVCVKWWKLGRWINGFRMRDESHSLRVSLADLATENGEEILNVLHRGAVHEVLHVEISISDATTTACQISQRRD